MEVVSVVQFMLSARAFGQNCFGFNTCWHVWCYIW